MNKVYNSQNDIASEMKEFVKAFVTIYIKFIIIFASSVSGEIKKGSLL